LLYALGVPLDQIQDMLGHGSPVTTKLIYVKVSFGSFPPDVESLPHFNGYAELRRLVPIVKPASRTSISHRAFERTGSTTKASSCWFIDGEGEVTLRNGETLSCRDGDILRVSAGSEHWHGASVEHHATHIAITIGATTWDGRPGWQRLSFLLGV
jgi:quercetin dioxygenase-like cupin family protein